MDLQKKDTEFIPLQFPHNQIITKVGNTAQTFTFGKSSGSQLRATWLAKGGIGENNKYCKFLFFCFRNTLHF